MGPTVSCGISLLSAAYDHATHLLCGRSSGYPHLFSLSCIWVRVASCEIGRASCRDGVRIGSHSRLLHVTSVCGIPPFYTSVVRSFVGVPPPLLSLLHMGEGVVMCDLFAVSPCPLSRWVPQSAVAYPFCPRHTTMLPTCCAVVRRGTPTSSLSLAYG